MKLDTATRKIAATMKNECLAVRLRMLNRVVTSLYDDALRPLKVRVSQMNILVAIANYPGISPSLIGGGLQLKKSSLSRNLDRMRTNGWITIRSEGRTHQVLLTASGARLMEKAFPRWKEAQKKARDVLGKDGLGGWALLP